MRKEIKGLIEENDRRNREIFDGFNPVTGLGAPGERTEVFISDFPVKRQLMPVRCLDNLLLRKVIKRKSIAECLRYDLGMESDENNIRKMVFLICRVRATEDPAFAFVMFYKIFHKLSGKMVPFVLNYPQRLVLKELEDMRLAGKPIRLVILKARQWGGSTLSQLYIKWMQDFRHDGWNSAILAHVKDASKRIKAMYTRALENQPGWSLGMNGFSLQFAPYEGSSNDFIVKTTGGQTVRTSVTSVASFENYDSLRSADLKCAHFSEVAYWKDTPSKVSEEVLSSLDGGIPLIPDTIEILESSGRSAAGYFHDTYQEAKDPGIPSAYRAIFIAFYQIENDRLDVNNKEKFATWLYDNRDNGQCPEGWRKPGKFFWMLWKRGASFEAINWYRNRRNSYRTDTYLDTEAPYDDVVAFRASGNLVFNMYSVEALRLNSRQADPIYTGNVISDHEKGTKALKTARFGEDDSDGQMLKVWAFPDVLRVSNRYLVSVDIGGRSAKSDYSVMTVIDRFGMMPLMGGKPKVVARWRGHLRHDLLAWKAAELAHLYNDALLVFESNTADTEKGKYDTEGDHFGTVIEEIADYYYNLYIRESTVDEVTKKVTNKYGFHTNSLTKQQVIDNYVAYVDDQLYEEPDSMCFDEMTIYERREDGTIGNVPGPHNHDDIVMSTGIGLYVSQFKMPLPCFERKIKKAAKEFAGIESDI